MGLERVNGVQATQAPAPRMSSYTPTLEDSWPFRENKLPKVGSSLFS